VSLVCLVLLAIAPERWTASLATHLLTIVFGDIVLLAPLRFLVISFAPGATPIGQAAPRPAMRWTVVALLGMAIGGFFFLGEATEGNGIPAGRVILVAAVFIGLALAGLILAYAFLGAPLGLTMSADPARKESP